NIHIDKIGGDSPSVLQNINILNHYIGMKKIEPESIPELKYMPFIIMGLMALGLLAAGVNHRSFYLGWVILFGIIGIVGIYDFYLWEYDYGHSLDPKAPMKFPGASFQPPVFGTKHIINFVAKSFPHTGGYLAMVSAVLAMAAWWVKNKIDKTNEKNTSSSKYAVAN
ncbi:MAG: hypothetical protein AB8F94_06810, partial [Saprospiraceae bacterium]